MTSTPTPISAERMARTIMVMGTCSSAGKSTIVAGLCRWLARRGERVVPFKAQNMSNNAAVCADGAEIGRSQALQAYAAGVSPTSDMNPVLLKPEADNRSQVVVNGRAVRASSAQEYYKSRELLWPHVTAALDRLRSTNDWVVIEGAGSPAELNLTSVEIVNFAVARYCQANVILVGDIERGGVFAQLLGTLMLLAPEDRQLVRGLVVNKFRGDRSLFDSGVEILEERSGVSVWGVLPYLKHLELPDEDAVEISSNREESLSSIVAGHLNIAVVRLPHIANFDDFDPLRWDESIRLHYVSRASELSGAEVVIIPGTKNTIGDLEWLYQQGLADAIKDIARNGGHVVGICGGYQILGRRISNPQGLEGSSEYAEGLGLLDVETVFEPTKQTRQVDALVFPNSIAPGAAGLRLSGYEIHAGRTVAARPWLRFDYPGGDACGSCDDGADAADGRVWGCYLHEIFHNEPFRLAWLNAVRQRLDRSSNAPAKATLNAPLNAVLNANTSATSCDARGRVDRALDRLADCLDVELCLEKRLAEL